MTFQIAINGPDFLHKISGRADIGTELVLTVPSDWVCTDDPRFVRPPDGMSLASFNVHGDITFTGARRFREGIDTDLTVDVFLPYPWSKRQLVSKQPIEYVSKTGWFEGLFVWLKNKIKELSK